MTFRVRTFVLGALCAAAIAAVLISGDVPVGSAPGTMLPNGWRVTPSGTLTPLGTLPLHVVEDPSARWLAVTNSGDGEQSVAIVDEATGRVTDRASVKAEFYGLAFSPDGTTLYVGEAADGVGAFSFADGKLAPCPASACRAAGWHSPVKHPWVSGLAISTDGKTLYAVDGGSNALFALDAASGAQRWSAAVGDQPYAVSLNADGSRAYVSNWASASVSAVDTSSGNVVATIQTCVHPNAELMRPDGRALYVACANDNSVADIDPETDRMRLAIEAGLYPHSPEGATPNGLALSPDGGTLFVADADEDAVAAINVTADQPRNPRLGIMSVMPHVVGAIPAGWYVTDVAVSKDDHQLFILDGKGVSGHANPLFPHIDVLTTAQRGPTSDQYYVAKLATGDLERLGYPSSEQLTSGLAQARANSPYRPEARASSIPARLRSIKHVIYIIKENRTYDEVLGDDPRGNGDASLAIFGRKITPNVHRLAADFVLLDNYYCDSEVSADGHNWATAAYSTDYVTKLWPSSYSDRDRNYDFEQQGPASPSGGYLWDAADARKLTVRDYGEFVKFHTVPWQAAASGLAGRVDPTFAGFDMKIMDQTRVDSWMREFRDYVRRGDLPALEIMRLPDDHTAATRPGARTPYAMVADNDFALARMVEAVSRSRYWKDTIIFVTEDDAQAGPDHVSDQRAEALVVGGWIKRGYVDHTHYTMAGMIHTIEMLLNLRPMSQFDAGATPMFADFATAPDLRSWTASKPLVNLNSVNPAAGPDAQASMRLDLTRADAADPQTLNAILFDFARAHSRSL